MGKHALLIGVSHYPEGLGPLPAAKNDVAALAEVLADPNIGGFEVQQLVDPPDMVTMLRAIETFFRNRRPEDLLLLYFSGHGVMDPEGQFFFGTPETRKDGNDLIPSTAIRARDIHNCMKRCRTTRQVVILDCCHSGAFGDLVPRDGGEINLQDQLGGQGRVVLTASAAIDYSFERSDEPLAVYTNYLVKGLKTGAADRDGDGWVSADELHDYVVERLSKAAPGMSPQRYVVEDGEKIRLVQAKVADPERRYRELVKKYSPDGQIRPAGRRNLLRQQQQLNLSPEAAAIIEAEELRPYREAEENRREYEICLQEELEQSYPLDSRAEEELADLAKALNLSDSDKAAIDIRVIAAWERDHSPPPVAIPQPPPAAPKKVPATPKAPQAFVEAAVGTLDGKAIALHMLPIPEGRFLMGSVQGEKDARTSEYPQHEVTVPGFYLGQYPITQAQWRAIALLPQINRELKPDPSYFKGDNLPVECVSWLEAVEFCDRLSKASGKAYRLPTEAEWEYACRAGTTTPFYFGKTITTDQANYDGSNSNGIDRGKTTEVGMFPANAFGLYDMHGNVWEWCLDHWHSSYEGAPTNGSAWLTKGAKENASRLLRGGSWIDVPVHCRCAYRSYLVAGNSNWFIGFRVACDPPGL